MRPCSEPVCLCWGPTLVGLVKWAALPSSAPTWTPRGHGAVPQGALPFVAISARLLQFGPELPGEHQGIIVPPQCFTQSCSIFFRPRRPLKAYLGWVRGHHL